MNPKDMLLLLEAENELQKIDNILLEIQMEWQI